MSDPIYLSRVRISNFRTYGEDFELELPDAPGLTMLCGMNGLGKTAFFDAIEWGLLGEVQRFSAERLGRPEGSPLTRADAAPGAHRVELSWSGNLQVSRGADHGPAENQLVEILKDPAWVPQIHDLAVYLRLTHFLPQATRERFLEKESKTQWTLLQGPAGVERLERMRKLLDDTKARNAFERRINTLQSALDEATKLFEEWTRLAADHNRWAAIATASAATSPQELEPILSELEASLGLKKPPGEPAQRLATVRTAVEGARTRLRSLLAELAAHDASIGRHAHLSERLAALQAATLEREKNLIELQKSESELKERLTKLRDNVRGLEDKKRATEQQALRALAVVEAETRRQEMTKLRAAADEKIGSTNKQLAELIEKRNQHRQQLEHYDTAVKGRDLAREHLRLVRQLTEQWDACARQLREWDGRAPEEKSQKERRAVVDGQRLVAQKVLSEQVDKVRAVTERLKVEQRTVDEGTKALAQIVQHIHVSDTSCPVCAHEHPPGQLLQRAQASIERYSSRTAALLAELRQLQQAQADAERRLGVASGQLADLDRWQASRVKEREDLEKQQRNLLGSPILIGAAPAEVAGVLQRRQLELQQQEKHLSDRISALRLSDESLVTAQQFDSVEKRLRDEVQKLNAERDQKTASLQDSEAKLAVANDLIQAHGLAGMNEFRNECLRTAARMESEIRDAKANAEGVRKQAEERARQVAELKAKWDAELKLKNELQGEATKLVTAWQKLGLAGSPNESALREAKSKAVRDGADRDLQLEKIAALATGLESWSKREQLAILERRVAQVRAETKAKSNEECTQLLQQRRSERVVALQRARAAQTRAVEVAGRLMQWTGQFSRTALEPLSARISAFNRLISPFPYDFRIRPHVTPTRTRAEARVGIPTLRTNKVIDRDPEWWLSEGQMSAMGLSVLLGASTVYRWSRWRALLLDDPLQNTDLIHAAAFGDVIRSLMRDEQYQVVVSTHDYEEADFLARKCRRANLPVRRLELLSLGPNGVRCSVRDN